MDNEKILKIDSLIKESMVAKTTERTATLRLIKTKYLEFLTAKNAKPLDDVAEMSILKKMAAERRDSIKIYEENCRQDLADKEKAELNVIEEFLPKEPTEAEILGKLDDIIVGDKIDPVMKNMGMLIKKVKEAFPAADGSKVSKIVKERLS